MIRTITREVLADRVKPDDLDFSDIPTCSECGGKFSAGIEYDNSFEEHTPGFVCLECLETFLQVIK